jgi:UDP-glucose 4-epimerase
VECSDGTCVRDYLHIIDLAEGYLSALEALNQNSKVFDTSGPRFKAYNLGLGRRVSVFEVIAAMRKATGVDFATKLSDGGRASSPYLLCLTVG